MLDRRHLALLILAACAPRVAPTPPAPPPAPPPPPPPTVIVRPAAAAPPVMATPVDEDAVWFRAHYAKYEYRIPMRDGARLFTIVYVPADASPTHRYPILFFRTPYGIDPYGASRYPAHIPFAPLIRDGFILVDQDVRGAHMSEGTFVDMRPILPAGHGPREIDESTDAYDSIDWLIHHVDHNSGKVALWGQSYPGFYAAAGAIDSHPALVAAVPQAPIVDWWVGDDMHRNGALCLQEVFAFFASFGVPRPQPTDDEHWWKTFDYATPDAYQFFLDLGALPDVAGAAKTPIAFWKDLKAHPDYDQFWQDRNLEPRLKRVRAAMLIVGGWFDTEDLYGTLATYRGIEAQNPRTKNTLLMGPWKHGGWHDSSNQLLGDTDFGFRTDERFTDVLRAFLKHHLKGGPDPKLPEAYVFETGANRWRSFSAWPPKEARAASYWLRAGGALAAAPPAEADGFDEFLSDPARPVPYTANPETRDWSAGYMAEDQRFASRRPDVLVYQTAPLERDVTVAGPIDVELHVSTTGTDADWVVKLIDVSPGTMPGWQLRDVDDGKLDKGAQQLLVRGEPFRGRYRDSRSTPTPFVPGQVATVAYRLDDVLHTFQRGHRIMIQVQSSWFPFIDRNPQTFVPSIYAAKASDYVKATHRVHRGAATASVIKLRVLPAADEPR